MTGNLQLWDSVCRTDPAHTKQVKQRGGFTAIDAMYQVQEATRAFGPAGIGWGWDFELNFPANGTVMAIVTLWHGNKDQTVKQVGQKSLGEGRVDEDAAKKAVTDGLTKCLSYLGFNADVFLGKFDDNKYVESNRKEFAQEDEKKTKSVAAVKFVTNLAEKMKEVKTFSGNIAVLMDAKATLDKALFYDDAREAMSQEIRSQCFSQYKHMLGTVNSRDALLDTLSSWNHFRTFITGLSEGLASELAALEDEAASLFPAQEAAE